MMQQPTSADSDHLVREIASDVERRDQVRAIITDAWRGSFGAKGRNLSVHILRMSIGLGRLLQFVEGLEQGLGRKLSPIAVMQLGTVESLTEAVLTDVWPEPTPNVLLRDGSGEGAMFVFSAASGLILEQCELAYGIRFPGRLWGLQLPGLAGEAEPLADVAEIADYYTAAILSCAPSGPIHLIGYSFGGTLALEVALRLRKAQRELGFIALLDTGCDEKFWPRSEWMKNMAKRIFRRRTEAGRSPIAIARGMLKGAGTALHHLTRRLTQKASDTSPERSPYYIAGLDPNFQRVRDACIIAWQAYDPPKMDLDVMLFKSTGANQACDPESIWKGRISKLEVVGVPGTHATMVRRPHVKGLADQLSQRMLQYRQVDQTA